jgi:hypothetical protein
MKHRQKRGVMNAVWPITALYRGSVGFYAYWKPGRPIVPKKYLKKRK